MAPAPSRPMSPSVPRKPAKASARIASRAARRPVIADEDDYIVARTAVPVAAPIPPAPIDAPEIILEPPNVFLQAASTPAAASERTDVEEARAETAPTARRWRYHWEEHGNHNQIPDVVIPPPTDPTTEYVDHFQQDANPDRNPYPTMTQAEWITERNAINAQRNEQVKLTLELRTLRDTY